MNNCHNRPAHAGKELSLVKLPVRHSEEDEPEEGVEGGTKQREEISHTRNDLGEDESDDPDACHNGSPDTPSNDGIAVCMSRLAHNSVVDEFCTNVRVNDADDNGGNDNERKRSFLVGDDTQTTKSWRGGILAQISESDCRGNDEQEGGNASEDSQRLGEVLWSFHLGDEGGKEDLRNPEKGYVQNRVHASNPGSAGQWESIGFDWSVGRVVTVVSVKRSFLDTSKDEEEKDSQSHAGSYKTKTTMVSKHASIISWWRALVTDLRTST